MHDFTITGRSINYRTAAGNDTNMSFYNDNITGSQI